jgi:hypothetical protein
MQMANARPILDMPSAESSITAADNDQVIHEFGNTMDFRFDRRQKTEQI